MKALRKGTKVRILHDPIPSSMIYLTTDILDLAGKVVTVADVEQAFEYGDNEVEFLFTVNHPALQGLLLSSMWVQVL